MAGRNERLTLMAVHAHPDDEAIATGGVFAKAAAEGIRTILVTATRGEEGEVQNSAMDTPDVRHRLAEIRQQELARAADILGIDEVHYLGYRDSGMAGTPANDNPHNFHNADEEESVGRLVRLIRQTRPNVIVTYDEKGTYGHPDHIAAHVVTVAAFDAAGDPGRYAEFGLEPWKSQKLYIAAIPRSAAERFERMMRENGMLGETDEVESEVMKMAVPDEDVTTFVPVEEYLLQKHAAIRAHHSQVPEDHPLLKATEGAAKNLWTTETFIRIRSLVPAPDREDDLFAGLREPAAQLVS